MTDFAKRTHDHNYRLDPIVRSLLDTDFYKLLMQQFIWELYPNVVVRFKVSCRTPGYQDLAAVVGSDGKLRAQLDHARTLRYHANELVWLRGQTFYGQQGIFKPAFLEALRTYQLPEYQLGPDSEGNQCLWFEGLWWQVSPWEVPALAIVSELRTRAMLADFTASQLDATYARAKVRLHDKLQRVAHWRRQQAQTRKSEAEQYAKAEASGRRFEGYGNILYPELNITDFGTRRRHSFLWHEYCVLQACELLGPAFTGTSNVYLAYKHGLEPRGTNAHELPMVMAALAHAATPEDGSALVASQYGFLHRWGQYYPPALRMLLPDAYGTTQWLANAPAEFAGWRGARPDSKEPVAAGKELLAWWRGQGLTEEEVQGKLLLFSDGVDILLPMAGSSLLDDRRGSPDVLMLHEEFSKQCQVGFGIGTNLVNDLWGCAPPQVSWRADHLKALSLVCKVDRVNSHPAVKLSDNYRKATGEPAMVELYRAAFGTAGMEEVPVSV